MLVIAAGVHEAGEGENVGEGVFGDGIGVDASGIGEAGVGLLEAGDVKLVDAGANGLDVF